MTPELVFMMGEFAARFPTDRQYAKNHMWALRQDVDVRNSVAEAASFRKLAASATNYRFGFSAYAVRLLQDVYFLDWSVEAESPVTERQQIGFIESKKAESDLFAPLAGTLTRYNAELLADPSAINVDKYDAGWLFEIEGSGEPLLSPEQYVEHLVAVWEVTQRTIKGQMNE